MKKIWLILILIVAVVCMTIVCVFLYYSTQKGSLEGAIGERLLSYAQSNIDVVAPDSSMQPGAKKILELMQGVLVMDGVERSYLILLQNSMELRPGGGFVGQYATVDIKNGEVLRWDIGDANHLDRDIASDIAAPYPLAKWLGISKMKFRDSSWSPDFPTNARLAIDLFNKGSQKKTFSGVIAVNATVLESVLDVTGPVTVSGYEGHGQFTSQNALTQLLDVVEKPFLLAEKRAACVKREKETGIEAVCNTDLETGEKIKKVTHADRENRKNILPAFAEALIQSIVGDQSLSIVQRFNRIRDFLPKVVRITLEGLGNRDIQIWFPTPSYQSIIEQENWSGIFDNEWSDDYLSVVDANIGALKSDYYIERALEYTVDFTGTSAEINDVAAGRMVRYVTPRVQSQVLGQTYVADGPLATMRMRYTHSATVANYRTSDYHSYTRMFVPRDSQWQVREWFGVPDIDEEEGDTYGTRRVFGYKFDVFIGDTLPTMLQYVLPNHITQEGYMLKIQKQSGVREMPVTVKIILADGSVVQEDFVLVRDVIVHLKDDGANARLDVQFK